MDDGWMKTRRPERIPFNLKAESYCVKMNTKKTEKS